LTENSFSTILVINKKLDQLTPRNSESARLADRSCNSLNAADVIIIVYYVK